MAHSRMEMFEAKIAQKHVSLLPSNELKKLLEFYEVSWTYTFFTFDCKSGAQR